MLLYVYGSVVDGMSGYHALAHLIDDNLVQKVQPLEMTAVNVAADKLPSANLSTSAPSSGPNFPTGAHSKSDRIPD